MLKHGLMSALMGLLIASTPVAARAEAVVGEPAPAFTATDTNGQTHKLSDFNGKIVVLEWNNPECPYVVKHYGSGNMQKLQEKYTQEDVIWLTINSGAVGKQGHMDAAGANEYIETTGAHQSAYILDPTGEIGTLYGAKTTPHMYVIDTGGMLAYNGAIDSDDTTKADAIPGATNYIAAAIDALKAGEAVDVATTKPYGCGVKYE